MIVLTLNSGSTSVKLAAYRTAGLARSSPERLLAERHDTEGLEPRAVLQGFLAKLPPVDVVAHRVVHGGTRFPAPVRIDETTLAAIAELSDLAPLHNPVALEWIRAAREVWPEPVAHMAAFDTAFFARLPRVASEYALPRRLGTDLGVRRYGFHGLAHEAMWRRWCELHPDPPGGGRLITVQLGGGCSISALQNGRPLDTSMGFSPLEGLVMATRSGNLDPAVIPYLQRRLGITSDEVIELLNRESGLKGVSATENNPGTLLEQADPQAQFAVQLYCYRVRHYLGAYLTVLGGCDGLVFGGGVGEHVAGVRERILADLEWAGIELDRSANQAAVGAEARIDTARSAVRVYVIPVDEELVLARAAVSLLGAT
jgi:acetate kinase